MPPTEGWPVWATESVRILEPDPGWQEQGQRECARLGRRLAVWLVGVIEHVGSTAVPGLPAKPILDYQGEVVDLDCAPEVARLLEPGWHFVPPELDRRPFERFFVRVVDGHRRAHLHLMVLGASAMRERIAFRDALCADPERARAYAALKRKLAVEFGDDREAYTQAKGLFVQEVLRKHGDEGGH